MGADQFWTEERIEQLKTLWAMGLSSSVIAQRIHHPSRSAIIGKVHRLGLSGRKVQERKARIPRPRPSPEVGARVFNKRPAAVPRELRELTADNDYASIAALSVNDVPKVKFADLEDHHCRFPIGEVGHSEFGFCGDEKVPGLPYCQGHAARCFVADSRLKPGRQPRAAPYRPGDRFFTSSCVVMEDA